MEILKLSLKNKGNEQNISMVWFELSYEFIINKSLETLLLILCILILSALLNQFMIVIMAKGQ